MPMLGGTKGAVVAWIRASCATCGEVELSIDEVQLMICASTSQGSYVFRCPTCRLMVSKAAEENVIDVLVAAGAHLSVWRLPAELSEEHYGPSIGYDEILDFHFQLQADAWAEELDRMAGVMGQRPKRRFRERLEPAGPHET